MTLTPLPTKTAKGISRKHCLITVDRGMGSVEEKTLWYEIPDTVPLPPDDDCDPYVLAMLMEAMLENAVLKVKGSVSARLIENLCEYQSAWHCWLPKTFSIIEVEADKLRQSEARTEGAVCAFSGGIDAAFSIWRHHHKLCGHQSKEIKLGILIQGFDINLRQERLFENSLKSATETLSDLGIPVVPLKTNYREIAKSPWEYSHAAAFAGAFNLFKKTAGACVYGSTEPYNRMVIPWGSNPVTDQFLSSGDFRFIHDGASFTRVEKTVVVSEWQKAMDNLRVCWSSSGAHLNCGECEKCVRTAMNFLSSNLQVPKSLQGHDLVTKIKNMYLRNDVVLGEWEFSLEQAEKNGIEADWVDALREALRSKKTRLTNKMHHIVKAVFRKINKAVFRKIKLLR
jgi:hypothetical protein